MQMTRNTTVGLVVTSFQIIRVRYLDETELFCNLYLLVCENDHLFHCILSKKTRVEMS